MNKIILFLLIIFLSKHALTNNLFDTEFYEIKFESNNIEDEKIYKINNLKNKSLLGIFKKTLNDENFKIITNNLDEDLINTFIKNIIINNEKIIDDKYYAEIKINFNKTKIINYFRKNKISYVDYYPKKILLIILEKNNINNYLFSKNNNYYSYYIKKNLNDDLFKIPNLDINDRFLLKPDDLENKNFNKIKKFSAKYSLNEIVIIYADHQNNKVIFDLILISNDNLYEKKLNFNENNLEKFFPILEKETINSWKKINEIQNKVLNKIICEIEYFNMLELKEIREKLNNVSIIKNYIPKRLSYKKIKYEINFFGNNKILYYILNLEKLKINYHTNSCSIKLV